MGTVTIKEYRCAAKPLLKWVVHYPHGGKRLRKFFKARAQAELFAREMRLQIAELGIRASQLTRDARAEALACLERLAPYRVTLTQAVEFFLASRQAKERSRPIEELIPEYVGHKELSGRADRYLDNLRFRLAAFAKAFPTTPAEVTTVDLQAWLFGLPLAPGTKLTYKNVIHGFLEWARKRGWCDRNPAADLEVPRNRRNPPEIVSPEFMARLVAESEGDIRAFVVLGGFCGLRSIEIHRLDWSSVRLDRGLVDLSANVTKTAMRRIVTLLPAAKSWLQPLAKESGPVCGKAFDTRMQRWRRGREWPHNALRHSFVSYHLAHFGNPHQTRLQAGHSDQILFAHYRELVSKEEAEAWWGIRP